MDIELAKKFAKGRCTVSGPHYLGADRHKARERGPRYLPRVAGRGVTIQKRVTGYKTPEGAMRAARKYRDLNRKYLADHGVA